MKRTRVELVPKTLAEVRLDIDRMPADHRAQVSPAWLARIEDGTADAWTLGFSVVERATGVTVGGCGFKSAPDADGIVEIAYAIAPEHQGQGYATEAAEAMVVYAFAGGLVRLVCAHTLPESNASARVLTKCGFQNVGDVVDPEDGRVWRWERTSRTNSSRS